MLFNIEMKIIQRTKTLIMSQVTYVVLVQYILAKCITVDLVVLAEYKEPLSFS